MDGEGGRTKKPELNSGAIEKVRRMSSGVMNIEAGIIKKSRGRRDFCGC